MTSKTFLLPNLQYDLFALGNEVRNGKGFCVLRGLEVEQYSVEDNKAILGGIQNYVTERRGRQDDNGNIIGTHRVVQESKEYKSTGELKESFDAAQRLLIETKSEETVRKRRECTEVLNVEVGRAKYSKIKRGLSGFINATRVSAIADTGSALNVISAAYASDLKLPIEYASDSFQLGNSKTVQSIGRVTAELNCKYGSLMVF